MGVCCNHNRAVLPPHPFYWHTNWFLFGCAIGKERITDTGDSWQWHFFLLFCSTLNHSYFSWSLSNVATSILPLIQVPSNNSNSNLIYIFVLYCICILFTENAIDNGTVSGCCHFCGLKLLLSFLHSRLCKVCWCHCGYRRCQTHTWKNTYLVWKNVVVSCTDLR